MKDWPEFDIDQKNIGFILKLACPAIPELPSAEDRKKKDERHEKYEKTVPRMMKLKESHYTIMTNRILRLKIIN